MARNVRVVKAVDVATHNLCSKVFLIVFDLKGEWVL